MKQNWHRTQALASAQTPRAIAPATIAQSGIIASNATTATVYRLYTEYRPNLADIVGRYFSGFTVYQAVGVWQGDREASAVIEVIASSEALQDIVHLAGDIRVRNAQSVVLVSWQSVSSLSIGA